MKYCEFCGSPIEGVASCSCEEAIAEKSKKQKTIKKALITGSIIGILAVVLIITIAVVSTANKIDPVDYAEITFNGYNTNGTAILNFNTDELIYAIIGDEPEEPEKMAVWWNMYDEYSDAITYKLSSSDGLSNGDEITVEFIIPDSLSGKIKNGTHKYTVENLPELTYVEFFDHLEVSFEGISGEADAQIKIVDDEEYMDYFSLEIEPRYNLKNGDIVTITIGNAEEIANKYYIAPKESKKEFTVKKLPAYATSVEQLPKEKVKEIADKFVMAETESHTDDWLFSYGEVKYYGAFFLTPKENAQFVDENRLEIFICYDQYKGEEFWRTVYTPIEFADILISSDGKVILDYDDGSNSIFTTDMDAYWEKLEDDYIINKIN